MYYRYRSDGQDKGDRPPCTDWSPAREFRATCAELRRQNNGCRKTSRDDESRERSKPWFLLTYSSMLTTFVPNLVLR